MVLTDLSLGILGDTGRGPLKRKCNGWGFREVVLSFGLTPRGAMSRRLQRMFGKRDALRIGRSTGWNSRGDRNRFASVRLTVANGKFKVEVFGG